MKTAKNSTHKNKTLLLTHARNMGVAAYTNGIGCSPALCPDLSTMLDTTTSVSNMDLMHAWIDGWTEANFLDLAE